jgi:hypothetical protein
VQRYPSGCPYFTAPKSSNPIFNLYLKTQPSALSPQPSALNLQPQTPLLALFTLMVIFTSVLPVSPLLKLLGSAPFIAGGETLLRYRTNLWQRFADLKLAKSL